MLITEWNGFYGGPTIVKKQKQKFIISALISYFMMEHILSLE